MDNNKKMQGLLDYRGAEIFTDYNQQDDASFIVYRETTADGYEVFIAKHTEEESVSICDHVYYYYHDLEALIVEKVEEGESIYVDDQLFEDLYIEEKLADLYDEWQEEFKDNEDDTE